ncbi:MAG: GNAT family N-acetyltransferase [Candidatus Nanopelagicales bacterium]
MNEPTRPWLPPTFVHPTRVELMDGYHLRPIRGSDADLDLPAVMGSRERLWGYYGAHWGWPPPTMTMDQDREDLERHYAEVLAHESFNYALFDEGETRLLGCVYVDPPADATSDAEVSWWVVDDEVGSPLEAALDEFVPRWLRESWPFDSWSYLLDHQAPSR